MLPRNLDAQTSLLVISGTNGVLKSNIQEYKVKSKKQGLSSNRGSGSDSFSPKLLLYLESLQFWPSVSVL